MLKAGVARAVINPPHSVPHGGWGAQTHIYPEGIHQDLWLTALCLAENGSDHSPVILIDLDLCLISVAQADRIRGRVAAELGIDRFRIRVSTTHSHAGPVIQSSWFKDKASVEAYFESIVSQAGACAKEAFLRLQPVRIAAGTGSCGVGKQRIQTLANGRVITGYDPDGPADPTLSVVKLEAEDGSLVASIVHYACHPTTLGPGNKLVSPDYPGTVKRVVEHAAGGVCLFLQAAAGDIGPGPEGFRADYAAVERIGKTLGCEAVKTLMETETLPTEWRFEKIIESGASLGMWTKEPPNGPRGSRLLVATREIELPVKDQPPTEEAEREYLALQARMQELIDSGAPEEEIRQATYKVKRSHKVWQQSLHYYGQATAAIEAHLIAAGDIAFVGLPVEPFSATGKRIRERSPFAYTLFSGYSNGWIGYLPTAEHCKKGGYEVETSPFAEGAAEKLEGEIVAILAEMRRQGGESA